MSSGIYAITNTVTGKLYVGSAVDIDRRWQTHRTQLRAGVHHSQKLQRAWAKYGPDAFAFTVLEECDPTVLQDREQYWLDTLDSTRHGYNVNPTANSPRGLWADPMHRALRTQHIRNSRQTPEARARAAENMRTRYSDPAELDRAAERQRRRWADPEQRAVQSERMHVAAGTPENRARVTQQMRDRWADPAFKAAFAAQAVDKTRASWARLTPDERAARVAAITVAVNDPVVLERKRAAGRAQWADMDPDARTTRRAALVAARVRAQTEQRAAQGVTPDADGQRQCRICRAVKPLTAFRARNGGRSYDRMCKHCRGNPQLTTKSLVS
jgi:group I intron endonuclease